MRHLRGNLATTVVTVLVLAVLGAVAGYVWSALAPATRYVLVDGTPHLADPETQSLIEADGWFAAVTGAFGLVCAVAGYVLSRDRPVGVLVGLAAGGLLAGYVAMLVGGTAKGVVQAAGPGGYTTTTSLDLTAHGVLFAWPLVATAAFWVVEFAVTYNQRAR
ncbi:hypothetical protein [Microbispora sp. H10836]|uniref:hypothetical protein n=1 Tax=Microbispora sp. H10836 TaxID=2729106 RepID=UPI00147380B2|nr:hypothetical protein [Microbispora sp. H10836]